MTKATISLILAAAAQMFAQTAPYSYYYSDSLGSIGSNWTVNGTWNGSQNQGALISRIAVPTGSGYGASNEYEVSMTLNLTVSGGAYQQYFRATGNANFNPPTSGNPTGNATGTFSMVQLTPSFTSYGCVGTLTQWDVANGSTTLLNTVTVPCYTGMVVRSVVYGGTLSTLIEGQIYTTNTYNFANGQPGVGMAYNPGGNGVAQVQLGQRSLALPAAIQASTIAADPISTRIDIRWVEPLDTTGVGIAQHQIWRGIYGGAPSFYATVPNAGGFTDSNVMGETAYNYGLIDTSFHGVSGPMTTFNVNTVSILNGNNDPRRVGVRATGVYYGAMGENIDMLSGNLNFTIPLLKAMGRNGSSVTFSLSYNSQMWRQDGTGTWLLGEDVGYGIGFKLQVGALTPFWGGGAFSMVDHYQFTDSTGAEYVLYPANDGSGTYVSQESIYVTFDPSMSLLHTNDGTVWTMGCVSGGIEYDNGTMYPTQIEDSNGNQITITYMPGSGAPWPNSSARISTITDMRASGQGVPTYTFSYGNTGGNDPIVHLDTIRNSVGTSESFNFYTASGVSFIPPFPNAASLPTTTNLVYLVGGVGGMGAPNYTYHFFYDSAEEMTQVVFPAGGDMRWDYTNFIYTEARNLREVSNRYLAQGATGGGYGAEVTYPITHGSDSQYSGQISVHSTTTLDDPSGKGEKVWTFIPAGGQTNTAGTSWLLGLVSQFDQRSGSNGVSLKQDSYTWAQTPNTLNPYISQDVTVLNSGQSVSQSTTTQQTLDQYGNVTRKKVYDYGSGSPFRIYNYSYLSDSGYTSRYIRNRLATAVVTDGSGSNSATLVSNLYDGSSTAGCGGLTAPDYSTLSPPPFHDAAYGSLNGYRGNLTQSTTPQGYTASCYDILGNPYYTKAPHAPAVGVETSTGTNFSMPSLLTPNSNTSLDVSLSYSASFAPSAFTGPNGQTANVTYDSYGRPSNSRAVDGAFTAYSYSAAGVYPMTQTAVTGTGSGLPLTNPHWTLTTLDGLGRPVSVQSGPCTGMCDAGSLGAAVTETDTVYGPCACSPTGKTMKTSQPYKPGDTVYWTTYSYDGLGRPLTATAADGASATTYVYQGNTTKVTDPAGNWKTTTTDAQGNITQVAEPDPSDPMKKNTLYTNYTYDVMEHLTQVSMPRGSVIQTRTFNYDSTSHLLTSETHPETGTTSYSYSGGPDAATYDLLTKKTDAKGQVTAYGYDSYDRVTSIKRYLSNGTEDICQRVNYTYDSYTDAYSGFQSTGALGRVAAVATGDSSACQVTVGGYTVPQQFIQMFGYNQAGRVTAKRLELYQANGAAGFPGNYVTQWWDVANTYDAYGQVASTTYPGVAGSNQAGQTYTVGFDSMGRPNNLHDSRGFYAVLGTIYNAANQPVQTQFQYSNGFYGSGNAAFWEDRGYNNLNQLTSVSNFNDSPTAIDGALRVTYNYPATANNGQIASLTDNALGQTVSYTYDALRRLTAASASGGSAWNQSYGYDGFGNLTSKSGSGATFMNSVDQTTNRLAFGNFCYDSNGNVVSDQNGGGCGNPNYGYDVANRMVSAAVSGGTERYYYTADNKRVSTISSAGVQTIFIYGAAGEKLAVVFGGGGSIFTGQITNNVYFAGRLIKQGTDAISGTQAYAMNPDDAFVGIDRLGSVRKTQAGVTSYLPYGEELSATGNDAVKFATYTRDASTGLDYADQRYYSSGFGRFMSDDPSGDSWDISNPGSWNTYSYVLGDPVNKSDPSGLDPINLPPVVPGINCSTGFINYAAQFGQTIQQLFNSDTGILGVTSFFEQQGSGSVSDQNVWAAIDWTFLNQWNLSAAQKAWFYGPGKSPATFAATVISGSQVFSNGQLAGGFNTQLLNILTGSQNSSQCDGLAEAFDIAQGTINANNGVVIKGLAYIPNPVPGALQFGSNGSVPGHGNSVTQTPVQTIIDGRNTWVFYSDTPKPVKIAPVPRRRKGGL